MDRLGIAQRLDEIASRRDVGRCPTYALVRLPATLAPGDYVAKVTLVDKLGGKVAENRATFRIVTSLDSR